MAAIATPKDLRTAFETIVRGTHDIDDTYQLLTDARDLLMEEVKPNSSLKLDDTKSAGQADTYLTPIPLPTDWGGTAKIVVGIIPYYPIPFEQRIGYRFSARRFYIDENGKNLYLTGKASQSSGNTINHWYWPFMPPLTQTNENTDIVAGGLILWPQRFWRLLVWEAAFLYLGGIDGDDVAQRISKVQMEQYMRLKDNFIAWAVGNKLAAMGNAGGYAEEDDRPFDVGLL